VVLGRWPLFLLLFVEAECGVNLGGDEGNAFSATQNVAADQQLQTNYRCFSSAARMHFFIVVVVVSIVGRFHKTTNVCVVLLLDKKAGH